MDINVEYGVARSYIFMTINNFYVLQKKRSLQSLNDTTTITYYYCHDDDDDAYQTVT